MLCSFFIAGNCRFGSKCNNDHIDLKALLKTEVESVINGKQWILSCLGPFKESGCIPNFINDQSFEEVRWGFFESSKNGTLQQYLGSLMNEYNSSLNKLNALKMSTPETMEMLAQIYNSSTEQKPSNQPNAVKPSSFGTSSAAAVAPQNPFGAGIFGTSNSNNQSTMSTSNIFGAQPSSTSSFPQSSLSMFGESNDQKASFSFAQPKPSIFGQSQSIFGASQIQPQAPQSASIFASPQIQSADQQNSIFGGQSNIFGQRPFGSTQAPQTAPQSSIFSSQTPAQSQNMFASMQMQPPPPPQHQSVFGATSSNIFQQPATVFGQVQPVQSQQSAQNIFGGSMLPAPPQPPIQSVAPQSIFGIQQQPPQNSMPSFSGNPFQQQMPPSVSESAYSRLEDLTHEELQAFQGAEFVLGQIPLKPPAQNLC